MLGIVSAVGKNGQDPTQSNTMHIVSVLIFLVLTVLQACQTAVLARNHYSRGTSVNTVSSIPQQPMDFWISIMNSLGARYESSKDQKFGRRHATLILLLISLSLLVREVFTAVTVSNPRTQNTEHFWYPLLAIPEIVAVILYSAPGLVPSREELDRNQSQFGASGNGMQGGQYWHESEHIALANAHQGNYTPGRHRRDGGGNVSFGTGGAPSW